MVQKQQRLYSDQFMQPSHKFSQSEDFDKPFSDRLHTIKFTSNIFTNRAKHNVLNNINKNDKCSLILINYNFNQTFKVTGDPYTELRNYQIYQIGNDGGGRNILFECACKQ